jgi:hypothetical protein
MGGNNKQPLKGVKILELGGFIQDRGTFTAVQCPNLGKLPLPGINQDFPMRLVRHAWRRPGCGTPTTKRTGKSSGCLLSRSRVSASVKSSKHCSCAVAAVRCPGSRGDQWM